MLFPERGKKRKNTEQSGSSADTSSTDTPYVSDDDDDEERSTKRFASSAGLYTVTSICALYSSYNYRWLQKKPE